MVYKPSEELHSLAAELFTHPYNKYNKIADRYFKEDHRLATSMCQVAIACVRYFYMYPQQFGGAMENIFPTILVRMHKQMIKRMYSSSQEISSYMPAKLKLLHVGTRYFDQLIKDVETKNYTVHQDNLVKKRVGVGLRERRGYKEAQIKYYESFN